MVGNALKNRVDALEQETSTNWPTRWHWIFRQWDESPDGARAKYEREERPILAGEGIIWSKIVEWPRAA